MRQIQQAATATLFQQSDALVFKNQQNSALQLTGITRRHHALLLHLPRESAHLEVPSAYLFWEIIYMAESFSTKGFKFAGAR